MRVQKGKHIGREEVILLQAVSFKISSREAIDIQVDGEIIEGVRELEVSVLPGALRVLSNQSNI
jgi:diacylglycerol kinase family enzyme